MSELASSPSTQASELASSASSRAGRAWLRAARGFAVLVLLGLATMSLPFLTTGSPALAVLGVDAAPEQVAAFMARLDLAEPPPVRLLSWIGNALGGDLGTSLVSGLPVADEIAARLPVTLELLLVGQVVALAITLPVAMRSAWTPGGIADRIATALSFVLLSTPSFVLGLVLVLVFAVGLGAFPATGWVDFGRDPLGHLRHLVLPVLTIGLGEAAILTRVLRADLVATLREPYILAARSRGMGALRVLLTRALRPSSFATVTLVGLGIGLAFGGSVLIETIFAIPGTGRLAAAAIAARDFPVIEAVILFSGLAVVLASLLVDTAYTWIDPRTRHVDA